MWTIIIVMVIATLFVVFVPCGEHADDDTWSAGASDRESKGGSGGGGTGGCGGCGGCGG